LPKIEEDGKSWLRGPKLYKTVVEPHKKKKKKKLPIRDCLIQGDALSPSIFNFAVACTIRRVQFNHDGLKLNGTHQLLVYADGVNILGGGIHTVKKNTEALVVASKETDWTRSKC